MLLNDFSQLPVTGEDSDVIGAITWRSLSRARIADPDATVRDSTVRDVSIVSYDEDLLTVLPKVIAGDFVLVRDEALRVSGIVTTADLAEVYTQLASPFFIVGEIDRRLRHALKVISLERLNACRNSSRRLKSHDQMTMGDYSQIFANEQIWEQLFPRLSQAVFLERLNEIRSVRNDLMHFNNSDPLDPHVVNHLRHFVETLRPLTA